MEKGLWPWDPARFRSPPPSSCFPQTRMLREVALDLGSRGGVRESLSSTLASRGAHPLPRPLVPRVHPWTLPALPHPHGVIPSSLPVRNQLVV